MALNYGLVPPRLVHGIVKLLLVLLSDESVLLKLVQELSGLNVSLLLQRLVLPQNLSAFFLFLIKRLLLVEELGLQLL